MTPNQRHSAVHTSAKATNPIYVGLDAGSSKIGCAAIDSAGNLIRYTEFTLGKFKSRRFGHRGFLTQYIGQWQQGIRELLGTLKDDRVRVAGIGVTATTPTLTFTAASGRPLSKYAVLWLDQNRKGNANSSGTNLGLRKLAAIAPEAPELLRKTKFVLDSGSFITAWLTGSLSCNEACLSQKFAWSRQKGFDTRGIGIPNIEEYVGKLPKRVLRTGEIAGPLLGQMASLLGLPPMTPVCAAGYDSAASIIGGGICSASNAALVSLGTSVVVYIIPTRQNESRIDTWQYRPHLVPGDYKTIAGGFQAGLQSIKLMREKLLLSGTADAGEIEREIVEGEPVRPSGVFALPFGGVLAMAPLHQVLPTVISSGELVPSDLTTLIALRRGVAYFIKFSLDDLRRNHVGVNRIHVVGGGSASPSFCQLLADVTGLKVVDFGCHSAALGAAILTLVAVSRQNLGHVVQRMRYGKKSYQPNPDRKSLYEQGYDQFVRHLKAALEIASPGILSA
jgi:sugar (pentulose or hexulose) kinase